MESRTVGLPLLSPSCRFHELIGQKHSFLSRMDPRLFRTLENLCDAKIVHPGFPPNNPQAFLLLLAKHFPITHV